MTKEVKVTQKKLDAAGKPVIDAKTEKALLETTRFPGIGFGAICELITLYNVLHAYDRVQLDELGGDAFKPRAERVVRRLATAAAAEGWAFAKLRAEIRRAKDPKPPADGALPQRTDAAILTMKDQRLVFDVSRASSLDADDLVRLSSQMTQMLRSSGFKKAVISL